MSMKNFKLFIILGSVMVLLTSCEKTREQFDFSKKAPDEFAIITRAPLEMPPNYELRAPTPGADRPQESAPEEQAKQALFGQTANESKIDGTTKGESILLQKTGAQQVDPNIRDVVDAETEEVIKENTSTFDRIMGKAGKKIDTPATVVDPIKEHERLIGNKKAGKPVTDGETPSIDQ